MEPNGLPSGAISVELFAVNASVPRYRHLLRCNCSTIAVNISTKVSGLSTVEVRGGEARDETTCGAFKASGSSTEGKGCPSSANSGAKAATKRPGLRVGEELIVEKREGGCRGGKLKGVGLTSGSIRRCARGTTIVVRSKYLAGRQSEGVVFGAGAYGRIVSSIKGDGAVSECASSRG